MTIRSRLFTGAFGFSPHGGLSSLAAVGLIAVAITLATPASTAERRQVADVIGAQVLACYHPTGRFERAFEIAESDLLRTSRYSHVPANVGLAYFLERYAAEDVTFIRIYWRGPITAASYQTDVAVATRGKGTERRTEIVADSALVPALPRLCRSAYEWVRTPADVANTAVPQVQRKL
jgi:hypothetical protein